MRTYIFVASMIACAFSLEAQVVATLSHLPEGKDEVSIRNGSSTALVAFAVIAKRVPGGASDGEDPLVRYSDTLIDSTATPLPSGEDRLVISIFMMDKLAKFHRLADEPIATAGILADGTTTGDPVLLTRMMSRRSNTLLAIETAMDTLSDAGRRNVSRSQLVEQFSWRIR